MGHLEQFRREIDEFMRYHPQSPLDHDQRHEFSGLNYYDLDESLILEVEIERFPEDEPVVVMETSTGDQQDYRRWGKFTFEVEGVEAALTLYVDSHGEYFLPFRDGTSGSDTYGAGRYMDDHRPAIQPLEGDRLRINFNYAYNPYCAYSPNFSCPLPPAENWLQVPIRAGEKILNR
jgi:hypothetical protein